MPRVPVYEQKVAPAALPGVRLGATTSPRTFGADIGAGLANVGDAVNKVYLEEKKKADQIAVLDADRAIVEFETSSLYDPKAGALTKRGRDAFGLPDTLLGAYDAKVAEIEKGLTNDEQRLAFKRSAISRRLDFDRTLQRHVASEIRKYDDQATESYLANETDAAIASGDMDRIALSIDRSRAALVDHQKRNGLPPEWLNQRIAAVQTKVHGGTIDRLLATGQDLAAKAYYGEHKAEIGGTELARIEKALEVGTLRGESQRQADGILAKHRDLTEAMAQARKIGDPDVRDEVERRVKDYFATAKAAEAEKRTEAYRRAANTLNQNGGDFGRVAPGDLAYLDGEQYVKLRALARHVREGTEPVTDYGAYYSLLQLAGNDATRAKFLQVDLMEHRHELDNAKFSELARLQANLRSGKADDETLDGYRTKKQVVDDALASIRVDPTPKPGTKHAETVNTFRKRVDEEILAMQRQTGKKATSADVQEVVDRLLIQGTVPGSGWVFDDRKRLFELQPGEAFDVGADEIPAAERKKIEEALTRANRPVTPATVAELFRMRHVRGEQPTEKPAGSGAIGAPY